MSYTSEELHEVKSALGRFYSKMPGTPTKTEHAMYQNAARILQRLIDDQAVGGLGDDNSLSDHTVSDVKELVESGEIDPQIALEAERAGKNRSTLVDWLESHIEGEDE